DRTQEKLERAPICFRKPLIPVGEVYFRRAGPATWTGPILTESLREFGVVPDTNKNEAPVTMTYDSHGFRNPEGMRDWEIAIAGDSFTELGFLRQEQIFTSVMGRLLGIRVLNLGVCATGPLTQLSYLREYGIADHTRNVMIVFFEGNDLADLDREWAALDRWKK